MIVLPKLVNISILFAKKASLVLLAQMNVLLLHIVEIVVAKLAFHVLHVRVFVAISHVTHEVFLGVEFLFLKEHFSVLQTQTTEFQRMLVLRKKTKKKGEDLFLSICFDKERKVEEFKEKSVRLLLLLLSFLLRLRVCV